MYSNLRYKENLKSLFLPVIFILKRVLFTIGVFYWVDRKGLLMFFSIFELLNLSFLLHVRPYKDRFQFKTEIFNGIYLMTLLVML